MANRVINLANFEQFTAINVLSDPGHIGGPVVIPNAVQIVLVWTQEDAKLGHNVTYGQAAPGFQPTVAVADALLTGLTTGANWTALAAFLASTTRLSAVILRDVRSPNLPQVQSAGAGAAGTSVSPALPNEVAAAVSLRTALAGPQNRGRMFIPGFATNALGAGNVIAATAVTALQNWAGSNVGGVYNAQSLPMVIGHVARAAYTGSTGTQHPARPAGVVTVTSLTVRDNHWDTVRRRGLK